MFYSIDNKAQYIKHMDKVCGKIHDSTVITFNYDEANKKAAVHLVNYYYKTEYYMYFNNIKMFFSTNFDVWGHGRNDIIEASKGNDEIILKTLYPLHAISQGNACPDSRTLDLLKKTIDNSLGMNLLTSSGNEITIVCDTILLEPDSIATETFTYKA